MILLITSRYGLTLNLCYNMQSPKRSTMREKHNIIHAGYIYTWCVKLE